MSFRFEAFVSFNSSLKSVDTLIKFAKQQEEVSNTEDRALFLKLSLVLMVTRFQVYVENILKEFSEGLNREGILISKISVPMRLNSLRIISSGFQVHKSLENWEAYSEEKLAMVKQYVEDLNLHFSNEIIDRRFKINTSFPLGKTGKNELISLFRQISGENIFETTKVDIDVLDGILSKRHLVIHQDIDPGLTEVEIIKFKNYLKKLGKYIHGVLARSIKDMKEVQN